jgi:peroxiredoxin
VRADIAPGGTFPDYELTDHTKTRHKLSELQGNAPMVLVLSRGHYCPKDHQQHLELAAAMQGGCRSPPLRCSQSLALSWGVCSVDGGDR